jgi:hypothetical protein
LAIILLDSMDIHRLSSPLGYPLDYPVGLDIQVRWIMAGYPVGYPGPVYPVPALIAPPAKTFDEPHTCRLVCFLCSDVEMV